MAETKRSAGVMLYERNDEAVRKALRRGEFDYLEAAGEVHEAEFFRAITRRPILDKLAASYPSPRTKHEVPLWVYIAGSITMRFHGEHHFNAFPLLVRAGGMIEAFGPSMGRKTEHPVSGDITLHCEGFNDKNRYDRQSPCDADYLRKMGRDTDAELLQHWFNVDVVTILKQEGCLDPEGIFIGDATYLFVPDNPKYEGSSLLWFDSDGHPVSEEEAAGRRDVMLRRCYKMVSLLHTNRAGEFFCYAGVRVVAGADHESPILWELVAEFVAHHGRGVMKRLIVDRGFLDGAALGCAKQTWGIEVLIPARRNMEIYTDVVGLAEGGLVEFENFEVPEARDPRHPANRPPSVRKMVESRARTLAKRKGIPYEPQPVPRLPRSESGCVRDLETFTSCPVPLTAIVNRETDAEGKVDYWVLLDTSAHTRPAQGRELYALRTVIEERHRQLKGFTDLQQFTSRAFSLVVSQIVFTLLTYTLTQWFLLRIKRQDLNARTRRRVEQLLQPRRTVIVLYWHNYVGYFDPLTYQELVLTLPEKARIKVLRKTRRLRRSIADALKNPRPP
jgi:hypothetical protein